ncbi:hypothetical protein [Flavobacterium sp.]|uniref:hypothetical protein n=1 Tax=Flavobacterium sp. TaxID=239 RepID=UPI00286A2556|nr:hypothetical protein [Flavobacterium sp.]
MTVEREEKLLKDLKIFALLVFLAITFFIKNDILKLSITIPFLFALAILTYRKYSRDKKEGKDLSRYKMGLFFIALTFVITAIFLLLPYFN